MKEIKLKQPSLFYSELDCGYKFSGW